MTDREKLVELLTDCDCPYPCKSADYLIENGVEIFSAEDEKVLKIARQRTMEAHGDLRYLQGVKFGVESAHKKRSWERLDSSYWRYTKDGGKWVDCITYRCPECMRKTVVKTNYCPDCGAMMDK